MKLTIVTGPAGVGKSTISKLIAEKSLKSCLIEGDDIYNLIVGGYVSPWKKGNFLDLFWKNVFSLIQNSLDAGFDVVFNYIISKSDIKKIKKQFHQIEIDFIVLMVNEETILKRDKLRLPDCQMGERCLVLLHELQNENFNENNIINTTNLNEFETLNVILSEKRFNINIAK